MFATTGIAWAATLNVSSTTGIAGQFVRNSTSGTNAALYALQKSRSANAPAVYGRASGTSGSALGVFGRADAPASWGVLGLHSASTGSGGGVKGSSASGSANAVGVLGEISRTSAGANSAAVRGINRGNGVNGIGIWGSQAAGGWGVFGQTNYGIGVYGKAPNGTGVFGEGNVFGVFSLGDIGLSNGSALSCNACVGPLAIGALPAARARHSVDQAIPSGTPTTLAFDSEDFDNTNLHNTTVNNSRLVASAAGLYEITANVVWAASATGVRTLSIVRDTGAILATSSQLPASSGTTGQNVTVLMSLAGGDYVEAQATQSSGVPVNIAASTALPAFSMHRVSS
jgi:hypothetical protein